jgi:hypothetical protein
MYIETWQIFMIIMVGATAYFSYKQGRRDGIASGVHVTINDLHSKGIVAIYQDELNGEVVVGRYDEVEFDETVELGEDEYDDEDHW